MNIVGATVQLLIQQAYDVRESRISGGPGWINSDRFDIAAKIERSTDTSVDSQTSADQIKAMDQQRERLRDLFADRFQLKIHCETKEMPVFVLTRG